MVKNKSKKGLFWQLYMVDTWVVQLFLSSFNHFLCTGVLS